MVRQAHHEVFDKLAMRPKSLKSLYLILSLSKDGAARRVRPPFGRTARGGTYTESG